MNVVTLRISLFTTLIFCNIILNAQTVELVHKMKSYVPLYKVKNLAFYKTESRKKELLWCTNGDASGNILLTDSIESTSNIDILCTAKNGVYFSKSIQKNNRITELWWSDGIKANTICISEKLNTKFLYISTCLSIENDNLVFIATTEKFGTELWVLDSNRTKISMLKDIRSGKEGSEISVLTSLRSVVYFSANDGENGKELWRTDGTEKGTYCVKDICNEGKATIDGRTEPLVIKGEKDGVLVAEVPNPIKNYDTYGPLWLTVFSNKIFFTANDGIRGRELWSSDGTASGTRLVQEFILGGDGGEPSNLCVENNCLYLQAKENKHERGSFFRYDNNKNKFVAFTTFLPVKELYEQTAFVYRKESYIRVKNEIFYKKIHIDPPKYNGTILCKTDSTLQNLYIIKNITNPDTYPQLHEFLGEVDGIAYFSAKGENYGELWQTDGTEKGTYKVWNSKYWQGAAPISLLEIDKKWVFVAFDDEGHPALWQLIQ